jgi:hypothetical protein
MAKAFSSESLPRTRSGVGTGSREENASNKEVEQNPRPLVQRLLWFAVLWLGGVGTVSIVAFGLRLWIAPK